MLLGQDESRSAVKWNVLLVVTLVTLQPETNLRPTVLHSPTSLLITRSGTGGGPGDGGYGSRMNIMKSNKSVSH